MSAGDTALLVEFGADAGSVRQTRQSVTNRVTALLAAPYQPGHGSAERRGIRGLHHEVVCAHRQTRGSRVLASSVQLDSAEKQIIML